MNLRFARVLFAFGTLLFMLPEGAFSADETTSGTGTNLRVKYEELTAPDFAEAVKTCEGVCVLPIGILEKHGPHLPLGTDMLDARKIALQAVEKEYAVVFPQYYFGQIYEAKHQPGTIAYSPELVWKLLEETCEELARNGLKKIVIVNGHGGNKAFLQYFCQAQLANRKDYAVIMFRPEEDPAVTAKVNALRKTTGDGHAGETETSMMLNNRPELVRIERGKDQSGENMKRLDHLPYVFTGIWWYARYPNHYSGDGSQASAQIGKLLMDSEASQLATLISKVKKDADLIKLQLEFFDRAEEPLKRGQ